MPSAVARGPSMKLVRNRTWSLLLAFLGVVAVTAQPPSLGRESLRTLEELGSALRALQIDTPGDPDAGALRCPECNVLHTRAGEAVYPFAVLAKRTTTPEYADRARRLARWLISRQEADGSWKETPEEWTGTTSDQLLMLARAYALMRSDLAPDERAAWERSMRRAADYLTGVMNNAFASINYCATSAAALATMHRLFPEGRWAAKAKQLAWEVAAAMDEDGFIAAEGERVFSGKYRSGHRVRVRHVAVGPRALRQAERRRRHPCPRSRVPEEPPVLRLPERRHRRFLGHQVQQMDHVR